MKKSIYIDASASISRIDNGIIENQLIEPDYKTLISPVKLRRMSRVMRMSNYAALTTLAEAACEIPDAINIATSYGCLTDTEKFLSNLIESKEEFSNPSSFINSTHNTLAGSLAILIKCKGQNFTFVNSENSFESALIDGITGIEEGCFENVLVGGVDEKIELLVKVCEINKIGEGASFVFLNEKKTTRSIAEIINVETDNSKMSNEEFMLKFIERSNIAKHEIDLILSSHNLSEGNIINYRDLSGIYPTAVSFAMDLALTLGEEKFILPDLKPFVNSKYILINTCYSKFSKSNILLRKLNR